LLCFFFQLLHVFAQSDSTLRTKEFAFISDTQSPMWVEAVVEARNQNERATRILFTDILKDSSLSAVFLFGDVTECGSKNDLWLPIDSFLTNANKRGLPVYAAIGNHDYMSSAKAGEVKFKQRFPLFQRTGYFVTIDNAAFVLLNSNFSELTDSESLRQRTWYAATLDSLEQAPSIVFVFVGCHHPPFTNNTMVGASDDVRRQFVPPFLAHKKCKLFLSGHSHAIEHLKKENKDFLVLGGGGGLQHTLLLGSKQKEHDLFPIQTKKRMFHYVRCSIAADSVKISVRMIKEDFSGIYPVYSFSLPR
jgi:Predicted phosphohydrolases